MESSGEISNAMSRSGPSFKTYKRRWLMLLVVCLLNFTNSVIWICFAPIANYTNSFYCTAEDNCDAANWLSLVFMIISIPTGVVAMWSVDKFGLRPSIVFGSWLNFLGSAVRVVSSLTMLPVHFRFPLVLTGQCIAAAAQPFIMYLPTKLAALWFPENQRALANTLGSMSNPLGILVANAAAPHIVTGPSKFLLLNSIVAGPCGVVALLSTFGVCSSRPVTPPSSSAAAIALPFWRGIKVTFKNPAFLTLMVCLGGGMGVFNAVYTLQQQILCAKGYSNDFAGLCGALVIGGGIFGSLVAGLILDKTKWFEEVIKFSMCGAATSICFYSVASLFHNLEVLIAFANSVFGIFGFAAYPAGLECGVECTYPVAEATSAGLIILTGQILGVIFIIVAQSLQQDLKDVDLPFETCTQGLAPGVGSVEAKDMLVPNLALAAVTSLFAIIVTLFFWPTYKRLNEELQLKLNTTRLLKRERDQELPSSNPSLNPSTQASTCSTLVSSSSCVDGPSPNMNSKDTAPVVETTMENSASI